MNSNACPPAQSPLLGHGAVQKRLLDRPDRPRPDEDFAGPLGLHNDENRAVYADRRRRFLDASKRYEKLNWETWTCSKARLHNDYVAALDLDFLGDATDETNSTIASNEEYTGKLLKKRTERRVNEIPKENSAVCNLDTWFRKYLIVNRLIAVARSVVLRNRLLGNLEKLRKLTPEALECFERDSKAYYGCYEEIFARFV
ncbi:unnamed protein product [Phyllotreta striolata]|uniref:Uncharacterized protein n=1 Tax=Phyllotreta striolata TaxID=444603 RepID=A0A9N9TLB7_PHYSR|nr:unnamed protein product [Phyllotreta striolata]